MVGHGSSSDWISSVSATGWEELSNKMHDEFSRLLFESEQGWKMIETTEESSDVWEKLDVGFRVRKVHCILHCPTTTAVSLINEWRKAAGASIILDVSATTRVVAIDSVAPVAIDSNRTLPCGTVVLCVNSLEPTAGAPLPSSTPLHAFVLSRVSEDTCRLTKFDVFDTDDSRATSTGLQHLQEYIRVNHSVEPAPVAPSLTTSEGPNTPTTVTPPSDMLPDGDVLGLLHKKGERAPGAAHPAVDANNANCGEPVRVSTFLWDHHFPAALQPLVKAYIAAAQAVLKDPRDVIFVTHMIFYLCLVVPSGLGLLLNFSWWQLLVHVALLAPSVAPFTHMLHNDSHNRGLFKPQHTLLNSIVSWVLCPFLGHTWNTYYYHHVKHHHVEGNGPDDLSSTLRYRRDSKLHFLLYFARFYFLTWCELSLYFVKRGRYAYAVKAGLGELGCQAMFWCFYLYSGNPAGAFCVFILPMNILRLGMMLGNWGQHAFVAAEQPDSDYLSSITCINHPYNRDCFNDGYHTSHHLNPLRHWADHTSSLVSGQRTYAKRGALVFKDIDFSGVWFRLMLGDWDHLARCLVQLEDGTNSNRLSHAEIVALLKSRVMPMSEAEIAAKYPKQKAA